MTTEQIVIRSQSLWHSVKVVSDVYYQLESAFFDDPSEDNKLCLDAVKRAMNKTKKKAEDFYEQEWNNV